jgi:hypothetical protein
MSSDTVQDESYRAIIVDLDLHIGAKLSGRHAKSTRSQRFQKPPVQGDRQVRGGRVDEGRPPPFGRIAVQGKLGHHQQRSANVVESQIHLSIAITEQPDAGYFLGHPIYLRWCVPMGKSHQQAKALANRADHSALNLHRSLGSPL